MTHFSFYYYTVLRIGVVMVVYTILRLLFLLFNWNELSALPLSEILFSFIHGLRFDMWAVLYINVLLTLISALVPSINSGYQKGLRIAYVFLNSIPFLVNVTDLEYFKFTNKRTDWSVIGISDDVQDQTAQLLGHYWYLILVFIGIVVLLWKLYPIQKSKQYKFNIVTGFGTFCLLIALNVLGMRGGFQLKPITPISAYQHGTMAGNLTLNSSFVFIQSLDKKDLEPLNYFSDEELENRLGNLRKSTPDSLIGIGKKQNVVLIIVESLSAEYTGFMNDYDGYTPFLDSLAKEGKFFKNSFANGRRSDEAVPSIFSGIPSLMDQSITTSLYQNNEFFSLFNEMESEGYQSAFFHGGKNGTMGFNRFVNKMGIDYYGKNEYPKPDDFDGNWGIFDEPYLQYVVGQINRTKKPFFASVFTLSSHQPYSIPEQHKDKFNKGKHAIHETVGYADFALSEFFKTAKSQDWYDSTLFIITADHTHRVIENEYRNTLGYYRVPLVLFHPSMELPINTNKIVEQVDITATMADYLGLDKTMIPYYSESVFSDEGNNSAIFHINNNFYLVKQDYYVKMTGDNNKAFNWLDQPIDSIDTETLNQLKTYRQYYNSRMISNSFMDNN